VRKFEQEACRNIWKYAAMCSEKVAMTSLPQYTRCKQWMAALRRCKLNIIGMEGDIALFTVLLTSLGDLSDVRATYALTCALALHADFSLTILPPVGSTR